MFEGTRPVMDYYQASGHMIKAFYNRRYIHRLILFVFVVFLSWELGGGDTDGVRWD